MDRYLEIIASFPTVVWTVPMGVVLIYWLLMILGALDLDVLEIDADADVDVDVDGDVAAAGAGGGGVFAGILDSLAVGTVPLTIVITLVVFGGFLFTFLVELYLQGLLGGFLGDALGAVIVLVASFLFGVWSASLAVRPLRPVFTTHTVRGGDHLLGRIATVSSSSVSSEYGTARFVYEDDPSNELHLQVVTDGEGDQPRRGDEVVLVDYDAERSVYTVAPLRAGPQRLHEPHSKPALPGIEAQATEQAADEHERN